MLYQDTQFRGLEISEALCKTGMVSPLMGLKPHFYGLYSPVSD